MIEIKCPGPAYFEASGGTNRKLVYVGETYHLPECRLEQHLRGYKAAKVFKRLRKERLGPDATNIEVSLPPETAVLKTALTGLDYVPWGNEFSTPVESKRAEKALAQKLRDLGYHVLSN